MKLGVIGGGTVGRATARCFVEHAEIRVYDVVKERATHNLYDTLCCNIVFLCLPTPQKENSLECDTSAIDNFFVNLIHSAWHYLRETTCFVLRSTVPIGTTRRLREQFRVPNLLHSPEFLTARCAITDAQIPARNIIGVCTEELKESHHLLAELYKKRFPGVTTFVMFSDESEAVKLILNSFFAVKVAYFNEVRQLADKLQLNWEAIMAGVLSDGRIAHSHTQVPGRDGFGFGGACLPKDLANLISCIQDCDEDLADVCMAAYSRNLRDRRR